VLINLLFSSNKHEHANLSAITRGNNGQDENIMANTPLFGLSDIICPH
jgi:hypothetical protein